MNSVPLLSGMELGKALHDTPHKNEFTEFSLSTSVIINSDEESRVSYANNNKFKEEESRVVILPRLPETNPSFTKYVNVVAPVIVTAISNMVLITSVTPRLCLRRELFLLRYVWDNIFIYVLNGLATVVKKLPFTVVKEILYFATPLAEFPST